MKPRTLPKYMESRPMKNGSTSYRVRMPDGKKVALGWNLEDALAQYKAMTPASVSEPERLAAELWSRHRKSAASRKIEFKLTLDDVRAMLAESGGKCSVTRRRFSNLKPKGVRIRPWAPSIDRLDSARGYVLGNCRLVCAYVNIAINQFGEKPFVDLIEGIVRRVVREEMLSNVRREQREPFTI